MTRRARRRLATLGLLASLALRAPRAGAQIITHEEGGAYRSPQSFAFELRFGPYTPSVDAPFTGREHPYQDYFGKSSRLMSQVELDYQLFHRFGSAAVGLSVGYISASANAFLADGSGQRSGDKTTLAFVPVGLSLVYRFDRLAETYGFPLVPYVKAGLDYAFWSITNGNGAIAKDDVTGKSGQGGTAGWHAAAGLSLLLDVFDPAAARSLDVDIGVNHTYLFFEFDHDDLSGLGQANKLHLGDTTWLAGILFEL